MALFILLLSLFVMPGPVRGAVSAGILPYSLSTKFSESHAVQAIVNEYHDGSSQRHALVSEGRRAWNLSKRLTTAQLTLLRNFAASLQGAAFYFYNPSETLPPYSNNPIGTSGQYLVRFNGDWSQTNGMVRSDSEIQLIELTTQSEDIPVVTVGGGGLPGGGGGSGPGGNRLIQVPVYPSIAAGEELRYPLNGQVGYGPIAYGGYLWAYGLGSTADYDPVSGGSGGGIYKSADGITWTKEGNSWFDFLPFAAYWDGSSATITILTCLTARIDTTFSGNIRGQLVDFNMDTGSYGVPSPVVDLVGSSPGWSQFLWSDGPEDPGNIRIFRLSSGAFRIIYKVKNESTNQAAVTDIGIYYVDYAGGAWTSPVVVAGGSENWYNPAYFVQDGDTIHVFYGVVEYANGGVLPGSGFPTVQRTGFEYMRVAGDGSMTSPQAISAMPGTGSYAHHAWIIETPIISGSNIILPASQIEDPDGTGTGHMGVLIGTPKENPTFTWVPLSGIPAYTSYPTDMKLLRLGSTVYFAWISFDASFTNIYQINLTTSSDDGLSWTPYQVLLNLRATPPARLGSELNEFGQPVTAFDMSYLYSISLGTHLDGSLGLMYTTWATYWTNAPSLLP